MDKSDETCSSHWLDKLSWNETTIKLSRMLRDENSQNQELESESGSNGKVTSVYSEENDYEYVLQCRRKEGFDSFPLLMKAREGYFIHSGLEDYNISIFVDDVFCLFGLQQIDMILATHSSFIKSSRNFTKSLFADIKPHEKYLLPYNFGAGCGIRVLPLLEASHIYPTVSHLLHDMPRYVKINREFEIGRKTLRKGGLLELKRIVERLINNKTVPHISCLHKDKEILLPHHIQGNFTVVPDSNCYEELKDVLATYSNFPLRISFSKCPSGEYMGYDMSWDLSSGEVILIDKFNFKRAVGVGFMNMSMSEILQCKKLSDFNPIYFFPICDSGELDNELLFSSTLDIQRHEIFTKLMDVFSKVDFNLDGVFCNVAIPLSAATEASVIDHPKNIPPSCRPTTISRSHVYENKQVDTIQNVVPLPPRVHPCRPTVERYYNSQVMADYNHENIDIVDDITDDRSDDSSYELPLDKSDIYEDATSLKITYKSHEKTKKNKTIKDAFLLLGVRKKLNKGKGVKENSSDAASPDGNVHNENASNAKILKNKHFGKGFHKGAVKIAIVSPEPVSDVVATCRELKLPATCKESGEIYPINVFCDNETDVYCSIATTVVANVSTTTSISVSSNLSPNFSSPFATRPSIPASLVPSSFSSQICPPPLVTLPSRSTAPRPSLSSISSLDDVPDDMESLSVSDVAQILRLNAMFDLAVMVGNDRIDGKIFLRLTEEMLVASPFNLSKYQAMKVRTIQEGHKTKM